MKNESGFEGGGGSDYQRSKRFCGMTFLIKLATEALVIVLRRLEGIVENSGEQALAQLGTRGCPRLSLALPPSNDFLYRARWTCKGEVIECSVEGVRFDCPEPGIAAGSETVDAGFELGESIW